MSARLVHVPVPVDTVDQISVKDTDAASNPKADWLVSHQHGLNGGLALQQA
jgi:hypothetical protein